MTPLLAPSRPRRAAARSMVPLLLVAAAMSPLGACSTSGAPTTAIAPGDTIGGIGGVPPGRAGALSLPPGESLTGDAPLVGDRALGNRLVLIGDSILAGASTRYGGEACSTLVPLGWQVAVEAEVGRPVSFGNDVLDARPAEEWDAAVVFLGTNYNGDDTAYADELGRILDRLAPRPIVLVSVTEYQPEEEEVNAVIAREDRARDYVDVFDWTSVSELPGVLSGDGVHPTDEGRQLLIDGLSDMLGRAPVVAGSPAGCLESESVDDSAGATASVPWTSRPRPTVRPGTVATTFPTAVTTTLAPATSAPATTSAPPPTTVAPTTVAPVDSTP